MYMSTHLHMHLPSNVRVHAVAEVGQGALGGHNNERILFFDAQSKIATEELT